MKTKKVLFINHEASRTGAPLFLANLLKWIGDETGMHFRILSKYGGELERDFKALAQVTLYHKEYSFERGWFRRTATCSAVRGLLNRFRFGRLRRELLRDHIGLVYSNTVTNGEILKFLSALNCPVVTHVHELESTISECGLDNWELVKKHTDHFIAVSDAVKQNLVTKHGIAEARVDVVYGFIPISKQRRSADDENSPRRVLDIPRDAIIVGSSGFGTRRKGKDLFIQLALSVNSKLDGRPVHFVWIGGNRDKSECYWTDYDIHLAGLSGKVHFIDQVPNPLDYYQEFDIFAMISREDPFPLVNLEVAALHKPIVCFEYAGGTPEFVGEDAGFVVPYLDINTMADKIVLLATDKELRKKRGGRGYEKVIESYDISVGAKKITKIIERFMATG